MSGRRPIDWDDVRRRLAAATAAADRAADTPDALAAVFRDRAAALAARGRENRAAGRKVLAFAVGGERYALDFARLAEVRPFADWTPVPGGPPHLLGVLNVGGDIRSVVDLGRLLGHPPGDLAGGYVLVVRRPGGAVGLRVDAVDGVREVPPDAAPPPADDPAFRLVEAVAGGLRILRADEVVGASS